jgi:hypothetical protein
MHSSKYSTLREKQELQMLSEVYERCWSTTTFICHTGHELFK